MNIRYLCNSCFTVEKDNSFLVFDYCSDAGDILELSNYSKAYVFISHKHLDHYTPQVFEWGGGNITWFMDSQIPTKAEGVRFKPGGEFSNDDIYVRAHGSTDIGVSFEVHINDIILYHAGDFNCWHWTLDNSIEEEIEARNAFDAELEKIANVMPSPDVAFFPVDPRMKGVYYEGAERFIYRMKPKYFIPMHFGNEYWASKQFAKKDNSKTIVLPIERKGQLIKVPF